MCSSRAFTEIHCTEVVVHLSCWQTYCSVPHLCGVRTMRGRGAPSWRLQAETSSSWVRSYRHIQALPCAFNSFVRAVTALPLHATSIEGVFGRKALSAVLCKLSVFGTYGRYDVFKASVASRPELLFLCRTYMNMTLQVAQQPRYSFSLEETHVLRRETNDCRFFLPLPLSPLLLCSIYQTNKRTDQTRSRCDSLRTRATQELRLSTTRRSSKTRCEKVLQRSYHICVIFGGYSGVAFCA